MLESTVRIIRLRKRILRIKHQSHPRRFEGYLTATQVAEKLKVRSHWIYDRINNGTIALEKDESTGSYLFPDTPETIQQLRKLRDGKINQVAY